jgi:hypothetical protein
MNPELKKEFHQNARALAICGVLLILLSFVPWVERSQEIGTEGPLVYTAHLPSRVREFMQSDDFVAGSKPQLRSAVISSRVLSRSEME